MALIMQQYIPVFNSPTMTWTIVFGIIGWPLLWGVTLGVLMLMDALECFLHTIRLHWVEFQNKFFKGEGYAFRPISFNQILTNVLEK
jgi:V-type H+-transporting ATPase subunit a